MTQWRKDRNGKFAGSTKTAPKVPSPSPYRGGAAEKTGAPATSGRAATGASAGDIMPPWPTRAEWDRAAAGTHLPAGLLPVARKTYHATFLRTWRTLAADPSRANDDPAIRHRESEQRAAAAIAGATTMPAADAKPGMTVRSTHPNGYGEQTIRHITVGHAHYAVPVGNGSWVSGRDIDAAHPDAHFITRRVLRLANDHTLEFLDDRDPLVRFPGLESSR